jgi:inosine-uridine nucleoside N-ribohydrolase
MTSNIAFRKGLLLLASAILWASSSPHSSAASDPVPVVFDTDMGNDIDDVFALGLLHALHSRGECRIAAITVSKDHPLAAPFCDAVNVFYGHGDIPIGVLRTGQASEAGPYLAKVMAPRSDGSPAFPHRLQRSGDAPAAVSVLRKTLATHRDGSVVVIAVGPLTNMRALLDSPPDDLCPLSGKALVAAKVRQLVVMAGDFSEPKAEFNVFSDSASAARVFNDWPGELIACPFEMGKEIHFPEASLEKDFRSPGRHPLVEADLATFGKLNGFMAWDLVAALQAVRPDRGYFRLSEPGTIRLESTNVTRLEPGPAGKHRHLMPSGNAERVREVIAHLASQPPSAK